MRRACGADPPLRVAAATVAAVVFAAAIAAARAEAAEAPRVVAFTLSSMPMRNAGTAPVHVLDERARIAAALGAGLPASATRAAAEAGRRFDAGAGRRLAEASAGNRLAGELGIERLPAVVVDGRLVVYGVRDVGRALDLVGAWRARNGTPARGRGSRAEGRRAVPGPGEPLTRGRRAHDGGGSGTGESPDPASGGAEGNPGGETRQDAPARTLPSGERRGNVRTARTTVRGAAEGRDE